nr:metallophosphoesterase [Myxococcus sp. MH1]
MGRLLPLVVYLPAGVAIVGGIHYYLWARLVRDVGFGPTTAFGLKALLVFLAASVPLGVIASRLVPYRWSVWWLEPIYLWLGTSMLLAMGLAVMEVLPITTSRASSAAVVLVMGLGAAALAAHEARRVRVERVEIPLRKLPREFDRLRLVQLSDLHIGQTLGRAFLEEVVSQVNALAPDAVLITGDLVDGRVADIAADIAPLGALTSTYGTFFVTGNHEYHADAPEWCEHLGKLGVRVLRNEHVALERAGQVLHLAGIDDYEAAHFDVGHGPDLARAVEGRDRSKVLILMAHQPKAVQEAVRHGVDLQLSGHTHGGQFWPLRWLLRAGQPVVDGLRRVGDTLVYVSRGTGHSGPPMRLGVPPEITELVLRSEDDV